MTHKADAEWFYHDSTGRNSTGISLTQLQRVIQQHDVHSSTLIWHPTHVPKWTQVQLLPKSLKDQLLNVHIATPNPKRTHRHQSHHTKPRGKKPKHRLKDEPKSKSHSQSRTHSHSTTIPDPIHRASPSPGPIPYAKRKATTTHTRSTSHSNSSRTSVSESYSHSAHTNPEHAAYSLTNATVSATHSTSSVINTTTIQRGARISSLPLSIPFCAITSAHCAHAVLAVYG